MGVLRKMRNHWAPQNFRKSFQDVKNDREVEELKNKGEDLMIAHKLSVISKIYKKK